MGQRKSGKQRQASRRRAASKQTATEAAAVAPAPPPPPLCDWCEKRHEGDCPGPWCVICDEPLPPIITWRQVTCGEDSCRQERRRQMTRERVARWRAHRRDPAPEPDPDPFAPQPGDQPEDRILRHAAKFLRDKRLASEASEAERLAARKRATGD